jgi:hypothetical protein
VLLTILLWLPEEFWLQHTRQSRYSCQKQMAVSWRFFRVIGRNIYLHQFILNSYDPHPVSCWIRIEYFLHGGNWNSSDLNGSLNTKKSSRPKLGNARNLVNIHILFFSFYGLSLMVCSNSELPLTLCIRLTFDRTPWTWDETNAWPLNNTTQENADIHASSRIRTHDHSVWGAEPTP